MDATGWPCRANAEPRVVRTDRTSVITRNGRGRCDAQADLTNAADADFRLSSEQRAAAIVAGRDTPAVSQKTLTVDRNQAESTARATPTFSVATQSGTGNAVTCKLSDDGHGTSFDGNASGRHAKAK